MLLNNTYQPLGAAHLADTPAARRDTAVSPPALRPVPRQFTPTTLAAKVWRAAAALPPGRLLAVSSADGGVGRSTLVAALGGVLALAYADPVIAVDANVRPWGGLGERVGSGSGTVWDCVRELPRLRTGHDVERWTRRGPSGLLALAGEVEVSRHRHPPTYIELMTVADTLRALYPLVLLDLMSAESRGVWGALAASSSSLLVARHTAEGVRHVMRLLACQRTADTPQLSAVPILVTVATAPRTPREVRAVLRQAATVAASVHTIPYDPVLARCAPIDPRALGKATRRALLRLAAAVLQSSAATPVRRAATVAAGAS